MLPTDSDAIDDDDDDADAEKYSAADSVGSRLLVSGLASSVDAERLILAFEPFGAIVEARVARPGRGFVVFAAPAAADFALEKMQVPPPPPQQQRSSSSRRC